MLRRPLIRRGCSWPFKVAVLFNLRSSLFFPSSDRSTREVRRINSRGINLRARNQASRRIETLGLFSFPLFFFPPLLSLLVVVSFYSRLSFRLSDRHVVSNVSMMRTFDGFAMVAHDGENIQPPSFVPRPPLPFVFFIWPSRDCLRRSAETARQFSLYF